MAMVTSVTSAQSITSTPDHSDLYQYKPCQNAKAYSAHEHPKKFEFDQVQEAQLQHAVQQAFMLQPVYHTVAVPVCVAPQIYSGKGKGKGCKGLGKGERCEALQAHNEDEQSAKIRRINALEGELRNINARLIDGEHGALEERKQVIEAELSQLYMWLEQVNVTTVMVQNIPNDYSRTNFTDVLDGRGFATLYDFAYVPHDFNRKSKSNLGYAFVNATSHDAAKRMKVELTGHGGPENPWKKSSGSGKIVEVKWAHPVQGLTDYISQYQNSPVMHDQVPDEYKPAIFQNGARMPFPAATKLIQPPKQFR